jgi:hypothetical protein
VAGVPGGVEDDDAVRADQVDPETLATGCGKN